MKILALHSDFIEFTAKKKAIKEAEDIDKKSEKIKECLVVLTAVEKGDEKDLKSVVKRYVKEIKDVSKKINVKKIVLYPYAHLSSNLASGSKALKFMKDAEKVLKKDYKVTRAPFGWYKSFNISCKGHPLSELSREFGPCGDGGKELTSKEIESLLSQISRSKLNTAKLKDNDHRIVGQEMDLWSFNEVAPGMVFWHDKGLHIKNKLIEFWRELHKEEYEEISTPQIMDKKLWEVSGHWDKYSENNFKTKYENRNFLVKPMNCPGGMLVYKANAKSYRDLPLRVGELGIVHRRELSGVISGLFRVVQFTQDDAHIFCTAEQIEKEIEKVMVLTKKILTAFGLKIDHVELSTRPKKRIGTDKEWDFAEKTLEKVLKKKKMKYHINKGDGAFYGAKIDYHLKDSLDRTWQCSTIQFDMSLPRRFELEYTGKDGKPLRPIMLHRAIYGSLERFIGIITEHFDGKFPLWMNPNQVKVVTINDKCVKYAKKVKENLKNAGLRVENDYRSETIGKKVSEARNQRFNYVITIGEKEVEKKKLAVKHRDGKLEFGVDEGKFIESLLKEISERK